MKKVNKAQQIREYMTANPNAKGIDIAKKFKVGTAYVYQIKHGMKPKKINISASEAEVAEMLGLSIEEYAKRKALLDKKKTKAEKKAIHEAEAEADVNFEMIQNRRRNLGYQGQTVEGKFVPVPVGFTGKTLKELDEAWENANPKIRMQSSQDSQWHDRRIPKFDNVNHPAHYKVGGIETIDFIDAKQLGYNLGNVIKYVSRANHKGNEIEDLKKAQWYLNREISKLTGEKA
jgi:hypothetical protein